MKRILFGLLAMAVLFGTSCASSKNAVDKRKQKLERKKKRNPHDCPKVDC